eukprot:COSAG04_NODE_5219_length_1697_cov_9.836045_1_plen_97_part_00
MAMSPPSWSLDPEASSTRVTAAAVGALRIGPIASMFDHELCFDHLQSYLEVAVERTFCSSFRSAKGRGANEAARCRQRVSARLLHANVAQVHLHLA